MRPRPLPASLCLSAVALLALLGCQNPSGGSTPAEPAKRADAPVVDPSGEWEVLFSGDSVDAWRGFRKEEFPSQGWQVIDGWLQVIENGGGGDIITRGQYQNFELELEWKAATKANSGIMYWVGEDHDYPWQTGPEFQILDDGEPHSNSSITAGGLYALYSPEGKTLRPAGEVNHARIVAASNRVEHYLNGVLVCSMVRGSKDWNDRVAKSKFNSMPAFGTLKKGHICLQDHGNNVWFRNIRVRELPNAEAALGKVEPIDLFNGRDLSGWTHLLNVPGAAMADTWKVQDGILHCAGQPIGYIRTEQDYTNYHLVVEWRWDPVTKKTGNSGVLMRMVGPDRIWPRSIEAQLMAGRAGDFWNIGQFPMKVAEDRTNGRHTAHLHANEKEPGEWNRYDILVAGERVELRVNGELLNSADECLETPGKICLQSEGAPIQFRTVRLYPLDVAARKGSP